MDGTDILVSDIDANVRKLIVHTTRLKNEHEQLTIEIKQLKQNNEAQHQIIKDLEEKIKILKIARVAEGKNENTDTRAKITELVREIDKCIRLLSA